MKKLVLTLAMAAVLAVSGVSCSQKSATTEAADLTSKIEKTTDPATIKTYVDQAKAYAEKLVKEGKVEEAKEFIAKIEPVVKEKAPALAGTLSTVSGALDKVTDAVGETASDKLEDAKAAAGAAADSVGSAASSVADAASQKAGELKDAAADKAQQAKDAVSDAAQKGADKVKDLLN